MPQFKTIVLEKSRNHAIIIKKNNSLHKRGVITMNKRFPVDVILQHNVDSTIIPYRIRFTSEEGEKQEYTIKGYTDLTGTQEGTMPDGVFIGFKDYVFRCKLHFGNKERIINLYCKPDRSSWFMTVVR